MNMKKKKFSDWFAEGNIVTIYGHPSAGMSNMMGLYTEKMIDKYKWDGKK